MVRPCVAHSEDAANLCDLDCRMADLKIVGVDRLRTEILVALSNGVTLRVSMKQLLSLDSPPMQEDEWRQDDKDDV